MLLIEHGAVATFGGFGASAQTYWFHCIFNINIGTGMLLKIAGGLFGTLVFANFTMLLSCLSRNLKITSVASVLAVVVLTRLSNTYSQIKLFYPLQFSSDAVVEDFFFCGRILVPEDNHGFRSGKHIIFCGSHFLFFCKNDSVWIFGRR